MKVAIMQPYFFPYPGQFHLIQSVDKWVALDTVQYIRHGWMNRNRILHPASGWQYITVPIRRHPKHTPIKDVVISPNFNFRARIVAQLNHYRNNAPYYEDTIQLVEKCLATKESSISRFNVNILNQICTHIGITFDFLHHSDFDPGIADNSDPGQRVLDICKALGATEYLSPAGGIHLLDTKRFSGAGVRVLVQDYRTFDYATGAFEYQPDLSVIDALMWNNPDNLRAHLECQQWHPAPE